MGWKTRGSYGGICVRECRNRGKMCKECYMWSEFEPIERARSRFKLRGKGKRARFEE